MSSPIAGVAVAVRPRIGGRPSTSAARRSPRYDGRKSWPHCDTQCASSTQNSENFTPASASCTVGVLTDSGVIITSLILPSRTAARSAARSFAVRVESMRTTATPAAFSLRNWSSISASSGDTTRVGPVQHQRGQLIGQRLAAAGRHDRQRVAARQHRFHDLRLPRAQLAEPEHLAHLVERAQQRGGRRRRGRRDTMVGALAAHRRRRQVGGRMRIVVGQRGAPDDHRRNAVVGGALRRQIRDSARCRITVSVARRGLRRARASSSELRLNSC